MSELDNPSINVQKLVKRLAKRFPDYDFDQPAQLDTRCKQSIDGRCKILKHLSYATDQDGNDFCIKQIKIVHEDNPYAHKVITCSAILKTKEQKDLETKGIF